MSLHLYDRARLTVLPHAPTLRTATEADWRAYHSIAHKFDPVEIVARFGVSPDKDDEFDFYTSKCENMLEYEGFYRQCNLTWAWITPMPVRVEPTGLHTVCDLPNPETQMTRVFRLTLIGGGQIKMSEKFEPWIHGPHEDALGFPHTICCAVDLRLTAAAGDGPLRRYSGAIDERCCEMRAAAALFVAGTPQDIADRTAATFQLIEAEGASPRDNFMALLDRSETCCVCRRPLRDHVSTLLGIGPDCARRVGLPHSIGVAGQIVGRRHELLGRVGGQSHDQPGTNVA
jgi:hypothetical protein